MEHQQENKKHNNSLKVQCIFDFCTKALIDCLMFFLAPSLLYTALRKSPYEIQGFDGGTYRCLMISLVTTGLSYVAATLITGHYTKLSARQRFKIVWPIFLFPVAFWLSIYALKAQGAHGNINITAFIGCLAITIFIAWQRALRI